MEDQQSGSGQAGNVQLRQSLLRSHPLQESRPLTPEMSGDDAYMVCPRHVCTASMQKIVFLVLDHAAFERVQNCTVLIFVQSASQCKV